MSLRCRFGYHNWEARRELFVEVKTCTRCGAESLNARLMERQQELIDQHNCQQQHQHDRECEDRMFFAVCKGLVPVLMEIETRRIELGFPRRTFE